MKDYEVKDKIVRAARVNENGIRSEMISSETGVLVFRIMKLCHDVQEDGYIRFDKQHGDTFLIYPTEKTGWFIAHGGYSEIYKSERKIRMWRLPKIIWGVAKEAISITIAFIAILISWWSYQQTKKNDTDSQNNKITEKRLDSLINAINVRIDKSADTATNKPDSIKKPFDKTGR